MITKFDYCLLTSSEKLCISKLEELENEVLSMTLIEISDHCKVSTATINRALKKIGFQNLKSYKKELNSTIQNNNTNILFEDKLSDLLYNFDNQIIEKIIEDIFNYKNIYIIAFGVTSSIALDFALHLQKFDINTIYISDSDMFDLINNSKDSMIIYISYSGKDSDMEKLAYKQKLLKKQVLITSTPNSLVQKHCNYIINTNTYKYDYFLKSRIPITIILMKILQSIYIKKR